MIIEDKTKTGILKVFSECLDDAKSWQKPYLSSWDKDKDEVFSEQLKVAIEMLKQRCIPNE